MRAEDRPVVAVPHHDHALGWEAIEVEDLVAVGVGEGEDGPLVEVEAGVERIAPEERYSQILHDRQEHDQLDEVHRGYHE